MSDHTTIIRTDYEPAEVIVRGGGGDDGRWFRVLNWFYDEVVPDLTGAGLKVMLGLLRHRDQASGLSRISRAQLATHLKLSPGTISDATKGLLAHPAGLLAEHPGAFETFPGRPFMGRQVRSSEPEFDRPNTSSTGRTPPLENARAPRLAQEKTEISGLEHAPHPSGLATVGAIERIARASRQGASGWAGFPVFWNLDGVLCPRVALGLLEVREPRRSVFLGLRPDVTVAEIDAEARRIKDNMRGVDKPPLLLLHRLCVAKGKRMPKAAPHTNNRLEQIREARVAEARREAGVGA